MTWDLSNYELGFNGDIYNYSVHKHQEIYSVKLEERSVWKRKLLMISKIISTISSSASLTTKSRSITQNQQSVE